MFYPRFIMSIILLFIFVPLSQQKLAAQSIPIDSSLSQNDTSHHMGSINTQIRYSTQLAQQSRSRLLDENQQNIQQLWSSWHKVLAEMSKRQLKQQGLPKASLWNVFTEDQKSNFHKIKDLSKKLLLNLRGSKSQKLKQSYFDLKEQIEQQKQEAIEAAEDQYRAPEEGKSYFWQTHQNDYQELISRKEKAIQALKLEQIQITKESHTYLTSLGIELSEAQVVHLFKRNSSDLMLDLLVTFAHLNLLIELVSERLQEALQREHYIQRATYYYSIYVGLVSLSLDLHSFTRSRIENEHIPKVQKIFRYFQQVQKESKQILVKELKENGKGDQSTQEENQAFINQIKQNIQIQDFTLQGVTAYLNYLDKQVKQIKYIEKMITRRLNVANNTYRTVHLSQKYLDLVKLGLKDLHTIRQIKIPEMLPIAQEKFTKVFDTVDRHLQDDLMPSISLTKE
jgi:hypothetical protein